MKKHLSTLKCDNPKCEWRVKGYVPDWHNKECPLCKKSIIITDDDLSVYKGLEALVRAGIGTFDIKSKKAGLKVTIDTSTLHQNTL